ncbi:hypothetical protein [Aquimarina brevivitae]|uniref:Glycosyl transferase family 1 n=1 Tax=Aquimarina brevivitae TaxID=323412 RepID=A0A4Q7PFP0_9FLAO|nr:hypothetical protein [Aquimarina brevivitae]RZS99284.1 hypothetical protein EV197_0493 [Aquimarina brevivitae]
MIGLTKNSKVYVVCPAKVATGGPELLHQLVHKLNLLGVAAQMVYLDEKTFTRSKSISALRTFSDPIHPLYQKYNTNHTDLYAIEDDRDNVIITPETHSGVVYMFKKMRRVIWWLSVDNFFIKQQEKKYKVKQFFFLNKPYNFPSGNDEVYHLAQSYYAVDFLKNKGVDKDQIGYVSDFLNSTFLASTDELNTDDRRKDVILYNPKKGYDITAKLMDLLPNVEWTPLINLSPQEVKELLISSKVYVDFGNHPGKDRFPREAAICGCCVITGKRGSANFKKDVFIPEKYKFENPVEQIESFTNTIENCFLNYDRAIEDFKEYRMRIMQEETQFVKDIKTIFEINL